MIKSRSAVQDYFSGNSEILAMANTFVPSLLQGGPDLRAEPLDMVINDFPREFGESVIGREHLYETPPCKPAACNVLLTSTMETRLTV